MNYTKLKLRSTNELDSNGKAVKDANGKTVVNYYTAVIYYSNTACSVDEKKELNVTTGVKIPKKYITTTTKEISKKLPDYDSEMDKIKDVQDRLEAIISAYTKKFLKKPLCSFVEKENEKPVVAEQKKLECLMDYYDSFLIYKSERVKKNSMGFYNNNVTCFEQFETRKRNGEKIKFHELETIDFWAKFIHFLSFEKEDTTRVKKDKKRFGLNNNTLTKRIKTITEFLRHVIDEHNIILNYPRIIKHIKDIKKKNEVREYEVTKFSLTHDELLYYYNFTPAFEELKRVKDGFLFLMLQGVRISDAISLKDGLDIVKKKGKWLIEKDSEKMGEEFQVELHPASLEVWQKWDGKLFDLYAQDFNEKLKEVMKLFFVWYKEHYEERFNDEYELTIVKKVKHGEVVTKTKMYKHELISSHFGRGSFLSLIGINEKLSLKEMMDKTGHKDIKTAMKYQKKVRDISAQELLPLSKIEVGNKKKVVKSKLKVA